MSDNNPVTDYTQWRDDILLDMRDSLARVLKGQEKAIIETRATIAAMQAELDRRALEAFWEAHPGLRLEVGDRLLFTPDSNRYFEANEFLEYSIPPIGRETTVGFMSLFNGHLGIDLEWVSYRVPLELVRGMRQAYLELHPSE